VIRVLLADDQALVRGGFRMIIDAEADMRVVAEAADGRQAVQQCRRGDIDVALLDVRMPDTDGIDAARLILSSPQPPRVLMLTTFDLDEYLYDALRAGASGFLLKTIDPAALVAAVRTVVSGHMLVAPELTRHLVERYVTPSQRPGVPGPLDHLTSRERDVVRLVGRGLANREIADRLYLSESTVKTHVVHILAKLHLRDRAQIVAAAYEAGLLIPGTDDP
jgi:DNA-binding NarL/FixJ family response regulator